MSSGAPVGSRGGPVGPRGGPVWVQWGPVGVQWGHVGVQRDPVEVQWGSFWDPFGVRLGSTWAPTQNTGNEELSGFLEDFIKGKRVYPTVYDKTGVRGGQPWIIESPLNSLEVAV